MYPVQTDTWTTIHPCTSLIPSKRSLLDHAWRHTISTFPLSFIWLSFSLLFELFNITAYRLKTRLTVMVMNLPIAWLPIIKDLGQSCSIYVTPLIIFSKLLSATTFSRPLWLRKSPFYKLYRNEYQMCASRPGKFRSVSLISWVLLPNPEKSIPVIKLSVDCHKSQNVLCSSSRAKVMGHWRKAGEK